MARKLFRAICDETHTTALIETAGRGNGQWGRPVKLSTVRVANDDLEVFDAQRILGNPKVETIESWSVDASSQGPRSKYGRTKAAMLEELSGHVRSSVIFDSGEIDSELRSEVLPLRAIMAEKLNAQLEVNTAPASARYASDDWAPTPEQKAQDMGRLTASLSQGGDEVDRPVRARGMRL